VLWEDVTCSYLGQNTFIFWGPGARKSGVWLHNGQVHNQGWESQIVGNCQGGDCEVAISEGRLLYRRIIIGMLIPKGPAGMVTDQRPGPG